MKEVYPKVLKAIEKADAVIIENTEASFSTSHQIMYAVIQRKPVLVLQRGKDHEQFSDSYLEAMNSPFVIVKQYSEENVRDVISSFLTSTVEGFNFKRYNFILNAQQSYYLSWLASGKGLTRSATLREILSEHQDQNDDFV